MDNNFNINLGKITLPPALSWVTQDCEHRSIALETLRKLEKKLNFRKNYLSKIYKYTDGIMIYELHRIIQFLLVELIKKNLNKEREFGAIERWQFQQIFELAYFILGEKLSPDFLQDLNELRNKFMHYPKYQNFKDILLGKKHKSIAYTISDKKYEYMWPIEISKKATHGAKELKKLWFQSSIFTISWLIGMLELDDKPCGIIFKMEDILTDSMKKRKNKS